MDSLVGEEIKDISELTAASLIKFGELTSIAGNVGEFLILDIEDFTENSSCCSNFSSFISVIATFLAAKFDIAHHYFIPFLISFTTSGSNKVEVSPN